jgi:signal transduction histidine kinase
MYFAEERERRRLSTNLHDSVSQTLFIAKMKLSSLLKENDFKNMTSQMNEVYDLLNESLSQTRT